MWTPEYFVRLLDLPPSVEGVTVPNNDGTFDIYINSLLSEERQQEKLAHELEHIRKDHFYNDIKTVREVEAEANGKTIPAAEPLPIPKEGEPLPLSLFTSLDALKKYILWQDDRHRRRTSETSEFLAETEAQYSAQTRRQSHDRIL